MDDVIRLENYVDAQCVRHVHLMSNVEIGRSTLRHYFPPADAKVVIGKELGVWHVRAEWPYKGILDIQAASWPKFRRLVVWNLEGCASVTEAFYNAAMEYERVLYGGKPEFAFMRKLPKGAREEIGGMPLIECEWMLERCVAVGGWDAGAQLASPPTAEAASPQIGEHDLGGVMQV